MQAPESITTERLILERPTANDLEEILLRYAGDAEVVSRLGWPRHRSLDDTRFFLGLSDDEWRRHGAGPFLIRDRRDRRLLGSTGIAVETPYRASTGYVLARDAWGHGYATESVRAMIALSHSLGIRRLYALVHPDHAASERVLERTGFAAEGVLRRHLVFPNLPDKSPLDCRVWSILLGEPA